MERQVAGLEIKRKNRKKIYELLYDQDGLTKQEIATALRLSLPTVTQYLKDLMEAGLIIQSGSVGYTGGRNAAAYSIVNDHRVAIGLDITRYHIYAAVVDLRGQIIHLDTVKIPFRRTPEYMCALAQTVKALIEHAGVREEQILGVSMGVPGIISVDGNEIEYGSTAALTGLHRAEASESIPFPTMFCRDADAACLAEMFGTECMDNAFYLLLSNSVSGSFYQKDQIFRGNTMRAARIEHICLDPNGRECYCGQKGCVDAYCNSTRLSFLANGVLRDMFAMVENRDEKAIERWEEYRFYLAKTINAIRMLYDCQVILGGYVGRHLDPYLEELKALTQQMDPYHENPSYIRTARVWKEAVAVGAALHYIVDFLNRI